MWVVDSGQLAQNGRRKLVAFGRGLSPQTIITSQSLSRDQYPLSHFDVSPFSTSAWVLSPAASVPLFLLGRGREDGRPSLNNRHPSGTEPLSNWETGQRTGGESKHLAPSGFYGFTAQVRDREGWRAHAGAVPLKQRPPQVRMWFPNDSNQDCLSFKWISVKLCIQIFCIP